MTAHFAFDAPPCPVHESGGSVHHVTTVPEGHLALVGNMDAYRHYVGNSGVSARVIRGGPAEFMLLLALAPCDAWDGNSIEPLQSGAFACHAGVVIDFDQNANVCLMDPRLGEHTVLANWLIPSVN